MSNESDGGFFTSTVFLTVSLTVVPVLSILFLVAVPVYHLVSTLLIFLCVYLKTRNEEDILDASMKKEYAVCGLCLFGYYSLCVLFWALVVIFPGIVLSLTIVLLPIELVFLCSGFLPSFLFWRFLLRTYRKSTSFSLEVLDERDFEEFFESGRKVIPPHAKFKILCYHSGKDINHDELSYEGFRTFQVLNFSDSSKDTIKRRNTAWHFIRCKCKSTLSERLIPKINEMKIILHEEYKHKDKYCRVIYKAPQFDVGKKQFILKTKENTPLPFLVRVFTDQQSLSFSLMKYLGFFNIIKSFTFSKRGVDVLEFVKTVEDGVLLDEGKDKRVPKPQMVLNEVVKVIENSGISSTNGIESDKENETERSDGNSQDQTESEDEEGISLSYVKD